MTTQSNTTFGQLFIDRQSGVDAGWVLRLTETDADGTRHQEDLDLGLAADVHVSVALQAAAPYVDVHDVVIL